jgi:hypothetical protein
MTPSTWLPKAPECDYAACSLCGRHGEAKADLLAAASGALHDLNELYGSEGKDETAVQEQLRATIRKAIGQ